MHEASYHHVSEFVRNYVRKRPSPITVADIGSTDVNGCFRPLFSDWDYNGLDIAPGPNVDRVILPYDFGLQEFDVVVSGSTAEHVEDLARWRTAIIRIMKRGGLLCVVAPHGLSFVAEHRHPVDCWRILPDGMRWLFRELLIHECLVGPIDTCLIAERHYFDHRSQRDVT